MRQPAAADRTQGPRLAPPGRHEPPQPAPGPTQAAQGAMQGSRHARPHPGDALASPSPAFSPPMLMEAMVPSVAVYSEGRSCLGAWSI